ncbi:hypothetical protein Q4566_02390 [Tamlana sp. 2_MG-2023]|uniref:hypothetical protein n=1 Tax=unclassified Tamlana TaxID=2614803 RepID=UPI0026E1BD54|nr:MULTISPECIES: hypothetical protein [unclassified Tamlana]MDO6759036.1 hypothetical protein [Tamlana sp. 2_MG-2023]MDO6789735.1 hypothetical protein [Tamlana sp. 1_MG-2023]
MIPQKIQALFEFINFIDENKKDYIEKYIPLCNELEELGKHRNALKPSGNYKDKQLYDSLQKLIMKKFIPITENIYNPITSKLKELKIWSGDNAYSSIWNNNISEIADFKRSFSETDLNQVFRYKQKYLNFRTETNSDFLCLSFVFSNLDEIMKELFDFFKDKEVNEFGVFESNTIEVSNFYELIQNLENNNGKNIRYSIPTKNIFQKNQKTTDKITNIKNEFNVFDMGDNIKVGNISNKNGSINLGKNNKVEINSNDKLAKKSFRWQKRETIISVIIGVIGIIIAWIS